MQALLFGSLPGVRDHVARRQRKQPLAVQDQRVPLRPGHVARGAVVAAGAFGLLVRLDAILGAAPDGQLTLAPLDAEVRGGRRSGGGCAVRPLTRAAQSYCRLGHVRPEDYGDDGDDAERPWVVRGGRVEGKRSGARACACPPLAYMRVQPGQVVYALAGPADVDRERVALTLSAAALARAGPPPSLAHVRLGRVGVGATHAPPPPSYMAVVSEHPGLRNPRGPAELAAFFGLLPPPPPPPVATAADTGPGGDGDRYGHWSLLPALRRGPLPLPQRARTLRRAQDRALALDKVAQGVTHQRAGRHKEALGCYERALQVRRRPKI